MNAPAKPSTPRDIIWQWIINLTWTVVWIVLYFMCINVFGNSIASIGIPALIVSMALVWFITERRNRRSLEEVP